MFETPPVIHTRSIMFSAVDMMNGLSPPLPPRPSCRPSPPLPPLPVDQPSLLPGHRSSTGHSAVSFPSIEVLPPPYSEFDEFPVFRNTSSDYNASDQDTTRPRTHSMDGPQRLLGRTQSAIATSGNSPHMTFPEPQITARSVSYTPIRRARSHMDNTPALHVQPSSISLASSNSTYYQGTDPDEIVLERVCIISRYDLNNT